MLRAAHHGSADRGDALRAFRPGQPFVTAGGRQGEVLSLLGGGGQGDVFEVTVDGVRVALKWYHRHCVELDVTLRERLTRAIRRGAPTGAFLWPLDLVDAPGAGSFGYVMPLRPARFVGIRDLIAPPPRRLELTLAQRAAVCLHIANCFHELHASGFCYQDINFGNFFLDPNTAEVLVCDNDNVAVDGAEASIYGTRKFMAPEVVRRETLPSSRTDLFSMAVLFFYVLLGWHPLDGRREAETRVLDADAEMRLYGTDPCFLFDPDCDSNGPVPGLHDAIVARWESFGEPLRRLFIRSFTQGLADPRGRVLETEWRTALQAVIDAQIACGSCGYERVAEFGGGGETWTPARCRACDAQLPSPLLLRVGRRAFTLTPGRKVEQAAIGGGSGDGVLLESHPSHADVLGLRNLSGRPWQVRLPDGSSHVVEGGRTVRAVPGMRLDFGGRNGFVVGGAA